MEVKKYRKKPVVIEAFQWDGLLNINEYKSFVGDSLIARIDEETRGVVLVIRTLEGDLICNKGDYIIKGVAGEFYPCKPDIFEATYEKAPDDELTLWF